MTDPRTIPVNLENAVFAEVREEIRHMIEVGLLGDSSYFHMPGRVSVSITLLVEPKSWQVEAAPPATVINSFHYGPADLNQAVEHVADILNTHGPSAMELLAGALGSGEQGSARIFPR
jgi:hypothetical protein